MDIAILSIIITIVIAVITTGISIWYKEREIIKLKREKKRVSWEEVTIGSRELLQKIQNGKVDVVPHSGIKEKDEALNKILRTKFDPTVIFVPCRRGATITNLMLDIQETKPVYVGIRLDKRKGNSASKEAEKLRNQKLLVANNVTTGCNINQEANQQKSCWIEVDTGKYFQFIPSQLIELLRENPQEKLLILDDYASSGDSQKEITQKIQETAEIKDYTRIRTAVLVIDHASIDKAIAHFWWLEKEGKDFYFPWGKAV